MILLPGGKSPHNRKITQHCLLWLLIFCQSLLCQQKRREYLAEHATQFHGLVHVLEQEDYIEGEKRQSIQVLVQNANGTFKSVEWQQHRVLMLRDFRMRSERSFLLTHLPGYPRFARRTYKPRRQGRAPILRRLSPNVQASHDGSVREHPGRAKILQLVQARFYFPGMRHAVEEYVRRCTICRRNKHDRHALYGLLKPLQIPTRPWQFVAMDFIVILLLSAVPSLRNPTTESW